jgi:hypothetical protein
MWGKFVYCEIVASERIFLLNCFSDEEGELTRHPMAPIWPLEMSSTTIFTGQNDQTIRARERAPLNPPVA